MKRFTLAAAAACSLLALGGPAGAADQELLIGSTSSSSSHYGYFVAVTQLINENVPGVSASVVETGATVDNLRRLSRDQIDLGLVTTNVGYQARTGVGAFEGRAVDTRFLWVYTVAPQNVVVRRDAGLSALADLEGVRFNPGIRGSATEATSEAVFSALGIAPDYVRGSTSDVVASIKDDRIAGYVKSGVGNKLDGSSLDIGTFTDIQVLGLTAEQRATLESEMPDVAVVSVPEGAGPGIGAYDTWAFGVGVVADPDLDEETAYQITKAINENVAAQASAFGSLKGQDIGRITMQVASVPLHPGALRYYQEAGYDVPPKLAAE
jgi:TRAP transporter TAXI family solute receptor